jgi:hypothetical protein
LRSSLRTVGLHILRAAHTALQQQFGPDVPIPGPTTARRWTVEGLEDRVLLSSIAGAVFVGTNHNNTKATNPNEPANQVVMYNRLDDGTLDLVGRFNTGGQGSGPSVRFAGDGLGSSHSVQLSQDKKFLFVTNAGSSGSCYSNPQLDSMAKDANAKPIDQSLDTYKAMNKILVDNTVTGNLFYGIQQYLVHPYVQGAGGNPLYDNYWSGLKILQH